MIYKNKIKVEIFYIITKKEGLRNGPLSLFCDIGKRDTYFICWNLNWIVKYNRLIENEYFRERKEINGREKEI